MSDNGLTQVHPQDGSGLEEQGPPRILIVDDEPDIELLIRQRFKRAGGRYDFVFARNGQEALERLETDPTIGLVITDINMPVMDGLTLLARLNHHNGRMLKSVILSAYGDMRNIRAAMNAGAFDFLTKPIDFQDFEVTLAKSLEALESSIQGARASAELIALREELAIAAKIQQSILPRDFFLDRKDFQVFGEMRPAEQVGGDFYDFFMIGEKELAFLIGDASGKGVPAALFMAVSHTLLKATAMQGIAPADCLGYMNRLLCKQGEDGSFVTLFYGILHTESGKLDFCLGGHNPPYIVSKDGQITALREPGGSVLGLLENSAYETGTVQLNPGDTIFLYTDGVTEAMNASEQFFTEKRLKQLLNGMHGRSPETISRAVLDEVERFAGDAPQADDITVLAVGRP
ncbi:MAG: SpoIIE family protein phosphatase [Bryobacteraceae bacterium]